MLSHSLTSDTELRLMMVHHAPVFAALARKNHEHLGAWLGWASPDFDDDRAKEMIQRYLNKLANNDGMMIGIFHQNQFAGWLSYLFWDWMHRRTEIGYWIGEEFQGKGIITRAVRAMTDYALRDLGLNRIEIRAEVENVRSWAVAERLGYTHESSARALIFRGDDYRDCKIYVMLAKDWKHDTQSS